MKQNWTNAAEAGPRAAVFDLDGALVDLREVPVFRPDDPRVARMATVPSEAPPAPTNPWVVDLANEHRSRGEALIILTSRSERWRLRSERWLQTHGLLHDRLVMRAADDLRTEVEYKRTALTGLRSEYDIVLVVDDNPAVVEMCRAEGIATVLVPGWIERPPL